MIRYRGFCRYGAADDGKAAQRAHSNSIGRPSGQRSTTARAGLLREIAVPDADASHLFVQFVQRNMQRTQREVRVAEKGDLGGLAVGKPILRTSTEVWVL